MSSRMLSHDVWNVVSVLLDSEKDDMRRWLRTEMDQLVDPFIDRLCHKLGTKLISALEQRELADCGDQMGMNATSITVPPNVHQSSSLNDAQTQPDGPINHTTNFNQEFTQSTQSTDTQFHLICHASTSTQCIDSFDPTSSSHQVQPNANYDQEGQTNVQVQVKEEFDESTTEYCENRDTQPNEHQLPNEHVNGYIDSDDDDDHICCNSAQAQIKEEVDESSNEQLIETDQTQYSVSLSTTNQNQSNQPNLSNQNEHENYDLDSGDDDEPIALHEECSHTAKKARMDSTQSQLESQSEVSMQLPLINHKQTNQGEQQIIVHQNDQNDAGDEELSLPAMNAIRETIEQPKPIKRYRTFIIRRPKHQQTDQLEPQPIELTNQNKQHITNEQLVTTTDQTHYCTSSQSNANQNQSNPNLTNKTEYENYDWDNDDECIDGNEISEKFEDIDDDNDGYDDECGLLHEPIIVDHNYGDTSMDAKIPRMDLTNQQDGQPQITQTQHNEHQPPIEHVNRDFDNDDDAENSAQAEENLDESTNEQLVSTDQTQYLPVTTTNQNQSIPILTNQTEYENYDWDDDDECVDGNEAMEEFEDSDDDDDADERDVLPERIKVDQNFEHSLQPTKRARMDQQQPQNVHSQVARLSLRLSEANQTNKEVIVGRDDEDADRDDEYSSRPGGNARIEPNKRLQTSKQPDGQQQSDQIEAQSVKANNQVFTLSLRCLVPECPHMFVQNKDNQAVDQLNHHLSIEHSIGFNRCVLKNCGQTFDNRRRLSEHINQIHRDTIDWQCDQCPKQYTSYYKLYNHTSRQHHLGQFQCAFPGCVFTGDYRDKVYSHYSSRHKDNDKPVRHKQIVYCQSGCGRHFTNVTSLNIHQLTHQGAVPYRCKWLHCAFVGRTRTHTILHIRNVHLKPNMHPNLSEAVFNDPKDYYEVAQDLM